MKWFIILKELKYRKANFSLALLALVLAVALFVSFFTLGQALKKETIRLTRDMGFNLSIIPEATDMNDYWISGYSKVTMPQEYIKSLVQFKDLSYAHLTATLHHTIQWKDKDVILTGVSPELEVEGNRKKTPMLFLVPENSVYLGFELATQFGVSPGDSIDVLGKQFFVEKTLVETGSQEDIKIYMDLPELQKLVNMEGRINEIKALNCLCLAEGVDPTEYLRKQLGQVLPKAKVIVNKTIANARKQQRHTIENYFAVILPIVIIVCFIWIAALAVINVNDRRQEIGIFRAVGFGSFSIAWLFIGKSLIIGVLAAILGYVIGVVLSMQLGPDIFKITASSIQMDYTLLLWSLLIAPVGAAVATIIPSLLAILQDPSTTLSHE
ncbi:FtsX-like permease family protein [Reichenbachiella sp. MALMAid0571]|uniref:ABC transporter permease n=1 Tax=Reichenbachiella sp. MALMAid0571 TaxID=3143939 RepID=UPI0032DE3F05